MKSIVLILFACLTVMSAHAQNVGINIPVPLAPLHVSGSTAEKLRLENITTLNTNINTELYFRTGSYFTGGLKTIGTGTAFSRLAFFTYASTSAIALLERLSITDAGNVGISAINPTEKLDVNGKAIIRDTLKLPFGSPGEGKVLTSDAIGNTRWASSSAGLTLPYSGSESSTQALFALSNDAGSCFTAYAPAASTYGFRGVTSGGIAVSGTANSGTGIDGYSNTGNAGVFQSQSGLAVKALGNVEISGKIKIVDGTQGVGKLLTSDGTGTASWVTPAVVTPPLAAGFSARKLSGSQLVAMELRPK